MSAIRKLAAEAADNGLLAPELAAGISRVKSVKSTGIRVGNWLSARQAQSLLNAPDITTLRGLRNRAILAVLLGCGLRRSEVAALTRHSARYNRSRRCAGTDRGSAFGGLFYACVNGGVNARVGAFVWVPRHPPLLPLRAVLGRVITVYKKEGRSFSKHARFGLCEVSLRPRRSIYLQQAPPSVNLPFEKT